MRDDYENRLFAAFRNMRPDDHEFFVTLAEAYAADYAKERPQLRLVRGGLSPLAAPLGPDFASDLSGT